MLDAYRKLMDLLDARERRRFWLLMGLLVLMGLVNMLGIASVMPFLAVLAYVGGRAVKVGATCALLRFPSLDSLATVLGLILNESAFMPRRYCGYGCGTN